MHSGHYEFWDMAFGLTGAPNSFEEATNRVLVFFGDILI